MLRQAALRGRQGQPRGRTATVSGDEYARNILPGQQTKGIVSAALGDVRGYVVYIADWSAARLVERVIGLVACVNHIIQ